MPKAERVWMLYNAVTKQQTKPIPTSAAHKFIMKIKVREVHQFYLWTPDWDSWKPLLPFLQSAENKDFVSPIPSLPPASEPETSPTETVRATTIGTGITLSGVESDEDPFTEENSLMYTDVELTHTPKIEKPNDFYQNFHGDELVLDTNSNKKKKKKVNLERRGGTRHDLKIEILILTSQGKSFRTYSRNISLGGTLVADPIPKEFFEKDVDLVIVNKFEKEKNGRLHLKARILPDAAEPCRLFFRGMTTPVIKDLEALLKSYLEHKKARKKSA